MIEKKILAVIPARGGSKGIPRKNISLLKGKPLIAHVIKIALDSRFITELFVSTDDDEIAEISSLYGANVIKRPKELAQDDTPLDPVIFHCVEQVEKKNNIRFDFVITLQPTSPLLSKKSLDKAIKTMIDNDYDTLISVTNETHLYWTKTNGKIIPLYKSRKNRQYLDPIYKETGSIIISKRETVTAKTRFGENIYLFELPKNESVDIDSYADWWTVEKLLNKKKILFRVDGDKDIGLGHVYRAIALAKRLMFNHDLVFLMDSQKKLGIKKVKEYHFDIVSCDNKSSFLEKIKEINPDIVINDILDTNEKYVKSLKKCGYLVVNFEDLGDGVEYADIVFNAIYENSHPAKNHFYGYKYICLRDEFYIFPKKSIKKNVDHILCTFGGTDPNNLTMKTLKAIEQMNRKNISYTIILGLGFSDKENLRNYASKLNDKGFSINIKENVSMMAKEMYDADIVITSNGRTIYEVSSVGTPCISIAQNEREAMHLFVHNSKCIKYLGMAISLNLDTLVSAMEELIDNYELRKEINQKLLKFDLKDGIERVINLIFDYEGE